MEVYICSNVFIPLRSGPSHKSEMLSQILFGEKYSIRGKAGNWIKVTTLFDNYSGWIDLDHVQSIPGTAEEKGHVLSRALRCYRSDGTKLVLEAGCEIYNPNFSDFTFQLGNDLFNTSESFSEAYIEVSESKAETAARFLNCPYIWGGRIPSGIDCSGLTQLVYKLHGITIPRDSWQQSEAGTVVSFLEEAENGDLLFFDNDKGKITHVGLLLAQGLVIHASGRVRIDRIDHQGIYRDDLRRYVHKLRTIRRIDA